ncbi:excinuclease ABC subunit UvrC [Candidatus Enterovibrio altilux]|uniref:UvrABC system protein C n=1 Tax=Candidatus Enterovibrio altilux TaxID=1927128 RepID=A0A291B787_9GAMM|nr:excinuclease ABC subunit UvrC [Candidatus Enterovibrio luxaltus]ATF08860.1 Excinuclease ABC subunit C [Candidatus Enterovibrio luxaltus]
MFNAIDFLKTVSNKPGVYRMMDASGEIIYVGKAKGLKKRLSSYFKKNMAGGKTQALVQKIANVEVTITHSETEALILEQNLIKLHLPRYNVLLRDDKSYPYIFLSASKHPRLSIHRGAQKHKGEYFGPFPDVGAVRQSLYFLQKIFPVRQCADSVYANRSRPCLMFQIGRCAGPCVKGVITDKQYDELVNFTRLFLQAKDKQVIAALVSKMEAARQVLAFEKAAEYRDQIQFLRRIQEQQFVSQNSGNDLDAVGVSIKNGIACIHVLFLRQGKVLESRSYFPKMPRNTDIHELVSSFIGQFYFNQTAGRIIPPNILIGQKMGEELERLSKVLSEIAGRKVHLHDNARGIYARFLKLAQTNAAFALTSKMNHKMTMHNRFNSLTAALGLEVVKRIECFDVSHTMGELTVASCVVFNHDGPVKQEYRRYNITGITGGDDYAAMAQVLERRYSKQIDPEKVPDIILIDGGKGQLNRAWNVVNSLMINWLKHPLMLGVTKGIRYRSGLETLVKVSGEKFSMPFDSPALHLIQYIRDESHNHAILGHRMKRARVRKTSMLQEIESVGPIRRQALLKYLGGIQELKRSSVEEIAKVPGISRVLAEKIHSSLQQL